MEKFLDSIDHPILFVFFITLAVWGATNLIKWGAKRANLPGLSSAVGN